MAQKMRYQIYPQVGTKKIVQNVELVILRNKDNADEDDGQV